MPDHHLDHGMIPPVDPVSFDIQGEVYQKGLKYQKPPITFDSTQWEPKAKEVLSGSAWSYVHGKAGNGDSDINNRAAFKK